MKQTFTSKLALKTMLSKQIVELTGKNNPNEYNLFIHHINEGKLEERQLNMDEVILDIMTNGLKCNYSSISRTLTHMGTNRSFSIDSILAYAYTARNYNIRNCIIVAIPKTIKTLTGEVIDFSTPMPEPVMWKNKAYTTYDLIKDPYRVNPVFNFVSLEINEETNEFTLTTNDQHFAKLTPKARDKYLTEFRTQLFNKGITK